MKFKLMFIIVPLCFIVTAPAFAVKRSDRVTVSGYTNTLMLELDGVRMGRIDSVDGLDIKTDIIEFQDGSDPLVLKRPGRVRYQNIILRKAQLLNDALWTWYQAILAGETQRKNGAIIFLNNQGQESVRYNFYNAWPCYWKGPSVGVDGEPDMVEEIQLAVDRIERQRSSTGRPGAAPRR